MLKFPPKRHFFGKNIGEKIYPPVGGGGGNLYLKLKFGGEKSAPPPLGGDLPPPEFPVISDPNQDRYPLRVVMPFGRASLNNIAAFSESNFTKIDGPKGLAFWKKSLLLGPLLNADKIS